MDQYRMFDPTSAHPMEWWTVELEDGTTVEVEYNGNGGFGPVNIWTGTKYLAPVKCREKKRDNRVSKADELLESIRHILKYRDMEMDLSYEEQLNGLAGLVEEFDRYLSSGGFFPTDWHESARRTLHPVISDDPWQSPESALKGKEPF